MKSLKQKFIRNDAVLGTMISEFATPNLVRMLQTAGFEFAIVDCEHGYFDFSQIAAMVAVGNGFSMPVLTRIPVAEREYITKVLDMGGDGVLVPMVNTADDARKVVEYAKYVPLGKRGLSTTRAHTNYNPPPLKEYLPGANERTMVLVQIETAQAVENAMEIAAVDGVDALMIGPNDLAADFGYPGDLETDAMFAAIDRVVSATRESGTVCGMLASKLSYLQRCRERGMKIFGCGSEVGMLMKAAKSTVVDFHGWHND